MDSIIKDELPKEAIEVDRKLSKLQNFVLDAAGPLAAANEELVTKKEPDPDLIQQAVPSSWRSGYWRTHLCSLLRRGGHELWDALILT